MAFMPHSGHWSLSTRTAQAGGKPTFNAVQKSVTCPKHLGFLARKHPVSSAGRLTRARALLGRVISKLAIVRLIRADYVKPFVKQQ
jgi:hypothetical protein